MNQQSVQAAAELSKTLELAIVAEQNRPDRFPGLATVFSRLPEVTLANLQPLSALKPDISFADLSVIRFCDLTGDRLGAVWGLLRAEKWNGNVYVLADARASLAFVEAATGYDGSCRSSVGVRELTSLERSVFDLLLTRLGRSLAEAFSAFVNVTFDLTTVANVDLVKTWEAPGTLMLVGRLRIQFGKSEGAVSFAIPKNLLEPIETALRVSPAVESGGSLPDGDPEWARQLSDEIARAFVVTKAILDERLVTLQEIAGLRVGSTIPLATLSISSARLEIDDRLLFSCELGKMQSHLALRIDQSIPDDIKTFEEF